MEKQELGLADSILDELLEPVKRRVATWIVDALMIGAIAEEPSNASYFVYERTVSEGRMKKHANVASNADEHAVASIATLIPHPALTFPRNAVAGAGEDEEARGAGALKS